MKLKFRGTRETESIGVTAVKAVLLLIVLSFLLAPLGRSREARDASPGGRHTALPARISAGAMFAVSAPESAEVAKLHVRTGDWVEAGQVLAELVSQELEAEKQRAALRVELAARALANASKPEGARSRAIDEEYQAALAYRRQLERRLASIDLEAARRAVAAASQYLERTQQLASRQLATREELENAERRLSGEQRNLSLLEQAVVEVNEQLAATTARLARAEAQRNGSGGGEDEMARLNFEEAEATLRLIAERQAQLVVKAPGSGRVVQLGARTGDRVLMGAPLLQIADLSRLHFDVAVTAKVAQMLRTGDAVEVILPKDPPVRVQAAISEILLLPEQQQPYVVRVTIPNPAPAEMMVGLEGAVRFPQERQSWSSRWWGGEGN